MRVLAIDSSGLTATVAVVEETQTVAEYTINYKKTHSQTLLPMIDEVVKMTELDLGTIDAIAVAGGPGSFTGLRIGSATAKGLGLALNKPLIHVPTVDGLAYNVFGCEDIICPIMDARRNQVYTGIYTFSKKAGEKEGTNLVEPVFQVIKMQMAVSIEELAERLNRYRRPVVFLGDGVPVYENVLAEKLTVPYSFAPAYMNRQRAAVVGTLAIQYYKSGKFETAEEHRPDYLRVSQAERERAQREKEAEIIVRELKVEDSAAVAEMEQQIFSDPWSEKSVLETVQQKQSVCFAAEKAGHLLGYLLAYHAADEAEIARIAVQKEARRQGAAGKLMQALEHYCEEHKMEKLLLDVRESNEAARSFYTKNGFVEDGIRQGFYVNPSEDAVLMSRQLGADV
ncbi:bifunctional tRNA (adenosine(37)-N6)-threonylcarbamoyltransferase complex dimerization subunit type 1 TsaB/ribosomal protein alanine acetyltransferase RimI [Mediterraneibacter gnavus]|uniref:bifunctional tRNA (adenosine(37)-N6)-threonylcarbamoyltransferase complex dimerization subunit type 1 TsaB/ribosomal protein alanine acetyltransferase RimI n=1 Tax=Mediterraneibacter gnavus TaxID=33038 RepID=UPI000463AD39|nr:bifunctional tRNA (adenosine(37)-N6)-threonylcarbamoyltransferase complex dimerization subunit type 1 TsaB/ribosomal protein alanine acetyltransferase RimI [Mediterraneibacter gnavus]MDB8711086.1 bifunctional tRNA (adenosine(37)-N6)-threonylcarbamoyltransferase complex dimerization subunit type 1 TsaB/ribosomal protein alanine acetyltransferase RimI [Mediterraneibacter gnavus]MDB8714362.1 bifunctional tRNA (adenosine(37)-N6)-threonylcarbamoyltransferase complex dimerization subunit type 1 TsaB